MSETVQTIKRKIVLLAEFTEPEVRRTVLHGQSVPLGVEPVSLHPLVTAFESLLVFFAKNYLSVSILYPIIGFTAGFIPFIVCAILYASGFKSNVKLKKHASYILTTAIIFVICVILVTMVAVYMKAQISLIPQLLAYIIIPIGYLINMLLFVAFYYTFSVKDSKK